MGQAIPGLAGILANTYMGVAKKAFPINTPLLQQMQHHQMLEAQYPNKQYIPDKPKVVARHPAKDVYIVKHTALDWLDEKIDHVRARGREWLSGRSNQTIEVDALKFEQKAPRYKYPPPVSDGLPVRLLPNGDYLWAPDVNAESVRFENCTVRGTANGTNSYNRGISDAGRDEAWLATSRQEW